MLNYVGLHDKTIKVQEELHAVYLKSIFLTSTYSAWLGHIYLPSDILSNHAKITECTFKQFHIFYILAEAQDGIAAALRRHSQVSSSTPGTIAESGEDEAFSPTLPEPPATVAPIETPAKTMPSVVKEPAAVPKKKVVIAATPVKAKSRSPSPTGKATVEKKSTGLDLGSLQSMVSKGKTQVTWGVHTCKYAAYPFTC